MSHRIWGWSLKRREIELAKCQVLCYNCHKTKTRMDRIVNLKPIIHGNQGYERNCRCTLCKKAHSIRIKEWKSKVNYSHK